MTCLRHVNTFACRLCIGIVDLGFGYLPRSVPRSARCRCRCRRRDFYNVRMNTLASDARYEGRVEMLPLPVRRDSRRDFANVRVNTLAPDASRGARVNTLRPPLRRRIHVTVATRSRLCTTPPRSRVAYASLWRPPYTRLMWSVMTSAARVSVRCRGGQVARRRVRRMNMFANARVQRDLRFATQRRRVVPTKGWNERVHATPATRLEKKNGATRTLLAGGNAPRRRFSMSARVLGSRLTDKTNPQAEG